MLATWSAVVGRDQPAKASPDSFNLLTALLAEKPARPCRDHLIIHGGADRLDIRQGPWKWIPGLGVHAGELFNLAETNDLADKNADKVKVLAGLLKQVREAGYSQPMGK